MVLYPDFKENSSAQFLTDKKRDNLKRAVYKYGGLRKLNNLFDLGLKIKHRPWSEEEVLAELKKISASGIKISQKSLSELDRHDLLGAVYKYGTLNTFKEKIGLPIKRHNYWSEERIVDQLKPIVEEFGRIPSEAIFKCLGRNDLLRAFEKRGGVKRFAFLLNTSSTGYYRSLDDHYLQSSYECLFDNILFKYGVKHEIHGKISDEHQYRYDFKIHDTFVEITGYNKIEHPEYHKRLREKLEVYENLNLKYIVIPKKIFELSISNIENKVLEILKSIMPGAWCATSSSAVDLNIVPAEHWADIENIKAELMPLVKKHGRMPMDRELRKENKIPLIYGIYRFHGSLYELGKLLNIPVLYKPKGYYTAQNAIEEYKHLSMKAGYFLSLKDLQQSKYYGLAGYISKNGGYHEIRKLTGLLFKSKRLPRDYYTDARVQEEYKKLCLTAGKFLSSKELHRADAGYLATYIQTHGGYFKIRDEIKLNFPIRQKPQDYWTKAKTMKEYREFVEKLGRKARQVDFKELKRQDLLGAIMKFGGLNKANAQLESL